MDLTSGYLNVPIHEDDRYITAFQALGALWEFNRAMFGLVNSGSSFCRLMHHAPGDLRDSDGLILFVDDILAHTDTVEAMLAKLEQIFIRL